MDGLFDSGWSGKLGESLAKRLVLKTMERIERGRLTIEDGGETYCFGQSVEDADIVAHIQVHHQATYRTVLTNGTIGAGEAYMLEGWSSPDLLKVVRLMVKNLPMLNRMNKKRAWGHQMASKIFHWLKANTVSGSKKNIAAHYDLGNDFYKLWLDDTMMYSSAIFPSPDSSLYDASVFKLDKLCRDLQLKPQDHLLEIGTGWGGLAIYAAQNYGCRVTTTTISEEQYQLAKQRVKTLGLADKITVLKKDYRKLTGKYDKLVSVEMVEAVGRKYFQSYFTQCNNLLKSDGLMSIQAITIADQRYEQSSKTVDYIQRYIFPGGCLPSNEVLAKCVSQYTDMQITQLDDITPHYATTLAKWRENFHSNLDQVKAQGFDDVFCRMWEYYLVYCEGGFRERSIGTVQMTMAKPDYRFPNPQS